MLRDGEENYLVYFCALFSQYLVDVYAKIETERLNFIRKNQSKLRSEYYRLRTRCWLVQIGQMVVLPSSFTGGSRYMHGDSKTYVPHYARSDLFITFTWNPRWEEITKKLLPVLKSYEPYDIISRVFPVKDKSSWIYQPKEKYLVV